MMTIGERIKETRKELGLNQAQFGERIALKQNTVGQIENGVRSVTERTIKLICREFGVDYEWLTTGEGAMFVDNADAFDLLVDNLLSSEKETAKAVFKALARLGGEEWKIFKKIVLDMAEELRK